MFSYLFSKHSRVFPVIVNSPFQHFQTNFNFYYLNHSDFIANANANPLISRHSSNQSNNLFDQNEKILYTFPHNHQFFLSLSPHHFHFKFTFHSAHSFTRQNEKVDKISKGAYLFAFYERSAFFPRNSKCYVARNSPSVTHSCCGFLIFVCIVNPHS